MPYIGKLFPGQICTYLTQKQYKEIFPAKIVKLPCSIGTG